MNPWTLLVAHIANILGGRGVVLLNRGCFVFFLGAYSTCHDQRCRGRAPEDENPRCPPRFSSETAKHASKRTGGPGPCVVKSEVADAMQWAHSLHGYNASRDPRCPNSPRDVPAGTTTSTGENTQWGIHGVSVLYRALLEFLRQRALLKQVLSCPAGPGHPQTDQTRARGCWLKET